MSCPVPKTGGLPVIRPAPILYWNQGGTQGLRLMSDLHLGASNVDEGLIVEELRHARKHGDRILLGGDVFDLILPGDRKRYSPEAVAFWARGRSDIQNAAVEHAEDLLSPYADLIDGVGVGNHETAAEKATSYDAVRDLVKALNHKRATSLPRINQLGYTAYVDYRIRSSLRIVGRYVIWYHHGSGKGGTVAGALNKLVGATASFAADLYWSGHYHARAHCTEVMLHCGRSGRVTSKDVKCVLTGSYMTAYGTQSQGSMERKGRKSNYGSEAALRPHGTGGTRVLLHFDTPGYPSRVEVIQ